MDPIVFGGLTSLGSTLLGGLLGKDKWEMSPQAKQLFEMLMAQYKGGVPSHVTAPITRAGERERAGIKQWFGSNLPAGTASGLELANLMRSGASEQRAVGEASSGYKSNLLRMLMGLSGQTQQQKSGAGQALGDIGGNLAWLYMLRDMGKQGSVDWDSIMNAVTGGGAGGVKYGF